MTSLSFRMIVLYYRIMLIRPMVRFIGLFMLAACSLSFTHAADKTLSSLIENITRGCTQPFAASYDFRYRRGSPPVYNHPGLAEVMRPPLHSPDFNPDERSIRVGIKIVSHLLLDCLAHRNNFESETF